MTLRDQLDQIARLEFEKWISSPPYEKEITRFNQSGAWPGAYQDYAVHLAWDAWQAVRSGGLGLAAVEPK